MSAAEQVFAARGLDASLEEVATAAGVGVGTVYRRFPSKAALMEAIFERRVDASVELLAECARRPSGWDGFREYLRRTVQVQTDDRGLHEFLAASGHIAQLRARVEPPLTELIERAKSEGALRADFRATDVPALTLMLIRLAHTDREVGPRLARRYLELILKGLGPTTDPETIEPPVDDDTLGDWFAALRRDR